MSIVDTGGSILPSFRQSGTNAVLRSIISKIGTVRDGADFGMVPDFNGVLGTNNAGFLQDAIDSFPHDAGVNRDSRGGRLVIPNGRYWMGSQRIIVDKSIFFDCGGKGFWEYASGVEFYWDHDGGFDFQDGSRSATGSSAAESVLSGVTLFCLSGGATEGIYTSTLIIVKQVKLEGFGQDNIFVNAEAPDGNASFCIFDDVLCDSPGKNNLHVAGADSNSCTFHSVRCSHAGVGFWNVLDESTIGNLYEVCQTQGSGGSYKTTALTASHKFDHCYTEGALAEIARGSIIIGGTLSLSNRLAPTCGAMVINGGEGLNRANLAISVSATRTVTADVPIVGGVGDDAAPPGGTGTVFNYGAIEEVGNSHRWKYDAPSKWWGNQYANAGAGWSYRIPGGTAGAPYHGPLFENGFYLGATSALLRFEFAAAMPTSGAYRQGSYCENTNKTILGGAGSRYVIKGWNRITTSSAHVLNTDWTEDRGLTGT